MGRKKMNKSKRRTKSKTRGRGTRGMSSKHNHASRPYKGQNTKTKFTKRHTSHKVKKHAPRSSMKKSFSCCFPMKRQSSYKDKHQHVMSPRKGNKQPHKVDKRSKSRSNSKTTRGHRKKGIAFKRNHPRNSTNGPNIKKKSAKHDSSPGADRPKSKRTRVARKKWMGAKHYHPRNSTKGPNNKKNFVKSDTEPHTKIDVWPEVEEQPRDLWCSLKQLFWCCFTKDKTTADDYRVSDTEPKQEEIHNHVRNSHKGEAKTSVDPTRVNKQARQFHDNYASRPKDKTTTAAVHQVSDEMFKGLREKGMATTRDYVGSAYEGTNIKEKSDYDIQFVKRDTRIKVEKSADAPEGFVQLTKDGKPVSATKYRDDCKRVVQKVINKGDIGEHSVNMKEHGPAFSLEISGKSGKIADMDVVPALQTADGTNFVPKPVKGTGKDHGDTSGLWRVSDAQTAKKLLYHADADNGCRKEVCRTTKVITKQETNLSHIPSYHLKSALLQVTDEKSNPKDWSRDRIGERTQDVVRYVADGYRTGNMPDHFNDNNNLVKNIKPSTRENTANRLDYLADHPDKMFTKK